MKVQVSSRWIPNRSEGSPPQTSAAPAWARSIQGEEPGRIPSLNQVHALAPGAFGSIRSKRTVFQASPAPARSRCGSFR